MLYVVNYANGEPYESYRRINSRTARWFGKADKVIEYSDANIPQSYKDKHKEIFAYKRGAGLWLWKPYLIHKALMSINEGDWLMYLDSGTTVINDIHKLIDFTNSQGQEVFLMEQPLLGRQFTKRECYELMGVEEKGENQALGLLLLQRTENTVKFVEEWLHACENEELLSPNHFHPEIEEFPDYFAHREDQSILSLLRVKHNLPIYRDCSDYGVMPWQYRGAGQWTYNPKEYPECKYPTIILCNRKAKPLNYFFKYLIKRIYYWFKPFNA